MCSGHEGDFMVSQVAHLVAEGLVVEAQVTGHVVEGLGLLGVLDVESVAHVHVEVVEVGVQRVHLDVLDGDAGEFELLVLVRGLVVRVLAEEAVDVLVEVVEGGVTEGSLVVGQHAGDDLWQENIFSAAPRHAVHTVWAGNPVTVLTPWS